MKLYDCSDLGAHIDGFIAVVAHTIVISSSLEKKVTGRKADVVLAAHFASQAALRLLKPGTEVGLRILMYCIAFTSILKLKSVKLNYKQILIYYYIFQTYTITGTVEKICDSYKCKPIEGMLSHQLKQFKIDGEKTIIQNPNDAQKKEHEKYTLETHEVIIYT